MLNLFRSFFWLLKALYDNNIFFFALDEEILKNVFIIDKEVKILPSYVSTIIKMNKDKKFMLEKMKKSCDELMSKLPLALKIYTPQVLNLCNP